MRLPKYISGSRAITTTRYVWLLAVLGVAWFGLSLPAEAQKRRALRGMVTGFDDVVFAISFSPDGRILAIARGASEPVQRFGRIELWDTDTGELRRLIKGFDGPVRSISFSPDGRTLISGSIEFHTPKIQQKARSRDGVSFSLLKWWDTQTGELKQKLIVPGEQTDSIRATHSPDGKQLALEEGFRELYFDSGRGLSHLLSRLAFRIKLVDAQTGEVRFKLEGDHLGAASFSPDGNLLAVTNGPEVKLWNAQTGKEIRKLKDLRGDANAVAFSPNGRVLAVASTRYKREFGQMTRIIGFSEVKLFDVTTWKATLRLVDVGGVNSLAFTRDGRFLLIGGVLPEYKDQAAGMNLVDFQTGKVTLLATGADHTEAVDSLALSRNDGLLAFRSGTATVKLLDTEKRVVKQTWDADSVGDAVARSTSRFLVSATRVLAVAFSADGTTVSGESDHGEIKFWDHRTGEVKRVLKGEHDDPSLVAASSDGKSFAELNQGNLLFWNANSETKTTVPFGVQETTALALSANGQMLALATRSEVTLLSPTGEVVKQLLVQEGVIGRLVFSSDGRLLAGADQSGTLRIWNVGTGEIEKTFMVGTEITALAFAENGEFMAAATSDNTVLIWNLQTGLPVEKFQKHDATINALAFSPNSEWLASGGDDRTIVLWDLAAGKSKRTFKGHDQTVTSLAFAPDGRLLASGSGNASVVMWEVETGKLSRVLR
jgi:WD40 repeat protein